MKGVRHTLYVVGSCITVSLLHYHYHTIALALASLVFVFGNMVTVMLCFEFGPQTTDTHISQ